MREDRCSTYFFPIDLSTAFTPSWFCPLCPLFQFFGLQVNFITILLVKLTSDGSKWPKLSFGEVLYRLKPRYYSFGNYYASVFCKFQEMRVYFLAEIRLYPFTHTVRIFVRQFWLAKVSPQSHIHNSRRKWNFGHSKTL